MTIPTRAEALRRLDILDAILTPYIDTDFVMAMRDDPNACLALIVLGAVECGVTKPAYWDRLHQSLTTAGEAAINAWIDCKLEDKDGSKNIR